LISFGAKIKYSGCLFDALPYDNVSFNYNVTRTRAKLSAAPYIQTRLARTAFLPHARADLRYICMYVTRVMPTYVNPKATSRRTFSHYFSRVYRRGFIREKFNADTRFTYDLYTCIDTNRVLYASNSYNNVIACHVYSVVKHSFREPLSFHLNARACAYNRLFTIE